MAQAYNHASAEVRTYQGNPHMVNPYQQVGSGSQVLPSEEILAIQTPIASSPASFSYSLSHQTYLSLGKRKNFYSQAVYYNKRDKSSYQDNQGWPYRWLLWLWGQASFFQSGGLGTEGNAIIRRHTHYKCFDSQPLEIFCHTSHSNNLFWVFCIPSTRTLGLRWPTPILQLRVSTCVLWHKVCDTKCYNQHGSHIESMDPFMHSKTFISITHVNKHEHHTFQHIHT